MNRNIALVLTGLMFILSAGCADKKPKRQDVTLPMAEMGAPLPGELETAQANLDAGQNKKAYKSLAKWIEKNPRSPYMDRALFLKGNALFAREHYFDAYLAYDKLLEDYSASGHFEQAIEKELVIGKLFLAGHKRKILNFIPISARGDGLEILDKVASHWAGSELAAQALLAQAEYFFSVGRFSEAQSTYQLLLDSYPRVGNRREILLRSAESTHAQYKNSEYDTTCLREALIRYRQLLSLYPEYAAEREVAGRIERIQWQQALEMYDTAGFYLRTKRLGAAKHYWTLISKEYPETEWATLSNAMLEKHN